MTGEAFLPADFLSCFMALKTGLDSFKLHVDAGELARRELGIDISPQHQANQQRDYFLHPHHSKNPAVSEQHSYRNMSGQRNEHDDGKR